MAAIPTWPILVREDTGPNVRALQCLLNYRNNNTALSVDGSFGPLVYNAVATFQRQNNIYADGQAGATCFVKLVSTVKRGAINSAVRAAQHLLNKFGSSLGVDGNFGPGTETAVQNFQRAMGIPQTKEVDEMTWRCLLGYSDYTLRGQDYRRHDILTSSQKAALNENKPFYQQAANAYGIPWQMLAAIHYRENKFSRSGPDNRNGPYQISGTNYPVGNYTDAQFQAATNDAAQFIAKTAGNRDLSIRENVKRTFYAYNGMAGEYVTQAQNLGLSAGAANGEGSPYVMNRADAKRDPTVEPTKSGKTWGQIKRDHQGIEYPATNDYGAYIVYELLLG